MDGMIIKKEYRIIHIIFMTNRLMVAIYFSENRSWNFTYGQL